MDSFQYERKRWTSVFNLSAVAVAIEGEHVSPEVFKKYASIPTLGTMRYSKYLGQTEGRAYVAVNEMAVFSTKKWTNRIYWVEATRLEDGLLQALEMMGNNEV